MLPRVVRCARSRDAVIWEMRKRFLKHAVGDGGIGIIKKPEDALLALRQDGAAARGRVRQGFGKRFPFFKKYTRSWMGNMELIMNGDVFAEAVGEAYWSVFP